MKDPEIIINKIVALFKLRPNMPTQFAVINPNSKHPTTIVKDLQTDNFYLIVFEGFICMQITRDLIEVLIQYVLDDCPRDRASCYGKNEDKNELFDYLKSIELPMCHAIRLNEDDSNYLLIATHIESKCILTISEASGMTIGILPDDLRIVHTFLTTPITLPPQ